jgi:hypothetical protein
MLSIPALESATGATAEVYAPIKKTVGKVPSLILLAATASLLLVGTVYADADASNATLDLRTPDLQSIPRLDQITAPAGSQEPKDIPVIGAPLPAERGSDLHVSGTGIGSLYWAFRHPAKAWEVVLPIS